MKRYLPKNIICILMIILLFGCRASDVKDAVDNPEVITGVERKPIDTQYLGINAFVNDSRFGSIEGQFLEVRDKLKLSFVRVLFNWDSNVQPTPSSAINFSFYDDIVAAIPSGVDALVVVTGLPNWMSDSKNWIQSNPRTTFVESFFRQVVNRYGDSARIIGWQVWNEPNMISNSDNLLLDIGENPENYLELLARAYSLSKEVAPNKLIVNAATTAINQNFPESLDYNEALASAGMENFIDRYAVHYYGRQFENVVRGGGVADFLNDRSKPIWITESGAQGVNSQLAYGEQVWPFLREKISGIERIYVYQFTESTPAASTYGLRNPSAESPVSDLYVFLRDR